MSNNISCIENGLFFSDFTDTRVVLKVVFLGVLITGLNIHLCHLNII